MLNLKPKIFVQKKISKKNRKYIEISVYLDDELVQKAIRKSKNNENVLKFLAFPRENSNYLSIIIPEKKEELVDNSDLFERVMNFEEKQNNTQIKKQEKEETKEEKIEWLDYN